ncbi:MAG: shikimate kinase AroK [Methylophilaceae bacterium]|nr:shikimate kinase AroK [Methylophilaceae bacterium]
MGNVFLVGLMGAGKTTVGRLLAKHFDMQFYDTDHEIELRTGVKIPIIFEVEGEDGFRKREISAIEELTKLQHIVLATGGGAVLAEENRQHLKNNGTVIYLRASVQELWRRTRNDKTRPLLQTENPRAKLEQLFEERNPLYSEIASIVVDTGGQPVNHIVQHLEELLSKQQTY